MPDGTIRYSGPEHVVFNGRTPVQTTGSGRVRVTTRCAATTATTASKAATATTNYIGGLGDDILIDNFGDDTLKGGDGNDTVAGQASAATSSRAPWQRLHRRRQRQDGNVRWGRATTSSTSARPEDESSATRVTTGSRAAVAAVNRSGRQQRSVPERSLRRPRAWTSTAASMDFDIEGGDDIMVLNACIHRCGGHAGLRLGDHRGETIAGQHRHGRHRRDACRRVERTATAATASRVCRAGTSTTCSAATIAPRRTSETGSPAMT